MERQEIPFLRDVDDVNLYAQMLENVLLLNYEYLGDVLAEFPLLHASDVCDDWFRDRGSMAETYEKLARLRHQMSVHIRDMADRRRRLSDASRGLPDVEFEKD